MRTDEENRAIVKRFTTATEPIAEYLWIDYRLGGLMLDCNIEPRKGVSGTNRRSSPILVDRHRDSMVRDEWLASTAGIGFSTDGSLVDGAHRLKGLLKAAQIDPAVTIYQLVCGGLDPRVKRVIDTNRKRNDPQILQMYGYVDNNRLSSVLRLLHCYDNVPWDFKSWEMRTRFNADQKLEMLAKNPDIVEAVGAGGRLAKNFKPFTATAAAASYFLGWRDLPDDVVDWFNDRLMDGLGLHAQDPVYRLREFLRLNDGRYSNITQLAYWIKAMNAHLQGRDDLTLHFRPAVENFPRLTVPAAWRQAEDGTEPLQ